MSRRRRLVQLLLVPVDRPPVKLGDDDDAKAGAVAAGGRETMFSRLTSGAMGAKSAPAPAAPTPKAKPSGPPPRSPRKKKKRSGRRR